MNGSGFPKFVFRTKDESITTATTVNDLSLMIPIFFGYAERGRVNEPVFGDFTALDAEFGDGTFSDVSAYFQHPNVFLNKYLEYGKCYYVRLASDNAAEATLILACGVFSDAGKIYLKWKSYTLAYVRTATSDPAATTANLKT
jgi:hypothetical protein